VEVVDTTGAGDVFTAALTVAMVSGMQPQDALERACVVGALTTTKMGAQSSPLAADII
jgi:ribokinase